jgi:PAS domain S-box-containing protein
MNDAHELRAAIDLVGLGRYRSDPLTQAIQWDARLKAMWGLAPDASVDLGVFLAGIHPEDRDRVQAALGQSVDPEGDGVCDIEYRVIGVNAGAERWVATRGKTVFEDGRVVSFHGVVLDISERRRAEHANLMLIAELEHRTRNLLAVVDSLAEQTLASCESLQDFAVPFRQRLATLSRVQGILFSRRDESRHDWRSGRAGAARPWRRSGWNPCDCRRSGGSAATSIRADIGVRPARARDECAKVRCTRCTERFTQRSLARDERRGHPNAETALVGRRHRIATHDSAAS